MPSGPIRQHLHILVPDLLQQIRQLLRMQLYPVHPLPSWAFSAQWAVPEFVPAVPFPIWTEVHPVCGAVSGVLSIYFLPVLRDSLHLQQWLVHHPVPLRQDKCPELDHQHPFLYFVPVPLRHLPELGPQQLYHVHIRLLPALPNQPMRQSVLQPLPRQQLLQRGRDLHLRKVHVPLSHLLDPNPLLDLPDRLPDFDQQVLELPCCHLCQCLGAVLGLPERMLGLLQCRLLHRVQCGVLPVWSQLRERRECLPAEWILSDRADLLELPKPLPDLQHECSGLPQLCLWLHFPPGPLSDRVPQGCFLIQLYLPGLRPLLLDLLRLGHLLLQLQDQLPDDP